MVYEVGKIIVEVDFEISEVIDFVYYYVEWVKDFEIVFGVEFVLLKVIVVIFFWNFLVVIFVGGVFVGFVFGLVVIIKFVKFIQCCGVVMIEVLWVVGVLCDLFVLVDFVLCDLGMWLVVNLLVDWVILMGVYEIVQLFCLF